MTRILSTFAALTLFVSPSIAQEPVKIPAEIKKHMQSMVGSWKFAGKQGDRKFSGEEKIRMVNRTALIQQGFFDLGDGKKETYVILSGWDGTKKTVIVRGFTSDGLSWSGEWKKLQNGKWTGTASGGKASFEVKKDSMRYEDEGEGTRWVSEFTRQER